ncbi:hypothetical protein BT96DRAFT_1071929 [Gymnopus androsaceus JB14]|uniref:Integrase catalytic domain-containing protein n=1 Tax=Gymnopus androsaceus JB14 TaxID=1447944 RepID=A0A6A4GUT1_9AGAR|nr:hypothetical protein BT96DRAFT_1071929 [Gymnopus androsaceus JB14]
MPVQSTHHSTHFNVIMDNYTSALGGGCFAKKNQANKIIQTTINQWEVKTGEKAQNICLDGVMEFHGEESSKYFRNKGISVQKTAAYSHQQNGKPSIGYGPLRTML